VTSDAELREQSLAEFRNSQPGNMGLTSWGCLRLLVADMTEMQKRERERIDPEGTMGVCTVQYTEFQ